MHQKDTQNGTCRAKMWLLTMAMLLERVVGVVDVGSKEERRQGAG
jgi:hypothetical protein